MSPLEEVFIISILALIVLAQGWEDIEEYAKAKKDWLGRFLKLEHVIPPRRRRGGVYGPRAARTEFQE
jgi:hypothetical protein